MQQLVQRVLTVEEGEHLIGCLVVEAGTGIRIDVRHHKINLSLGKIVERRRLREKEANKLVIAFHRALLVRSSRIAVENMSAE